MSNIPAIPLVPGEWVDTLLKLTGRQTEVRPAKYGLTSVYTLGQSTATAHSFMYGATPGSSGLTADAAGSLLEMTKRSSAEIVSFAVKALQAPAPAAAPADPLMSLPLDDPAQFSMSWTTFGGIAQSAQPLLPSWSASLADPDAATAQFWPTIAQYGLGYNLLLPAKVSAAQLPGLQSSFQSVWTSAMSAAAASGLLYVIDLSIFRTVEPSASGGATRFTPATVTLLMQNPATKDLTPVAISVAGFNGGNAQIYSRPGSSDAAWLYAIQAAKASVTVYGIWLGHVYHWHIVAASMQMTMFQNIPQSHPLYALLAPQSKYLMAFNNILLLLWSAIAPPTSIDGSWPFLKLCDTFAQGRSYFDDDPKATLARLGIQQSDFTQSQPWDKYPIVPFFLATWDATAAYVTTFVNQTYADDASVQNDKALQAWMQAAGSWLHGNIKGLPPMQSKGALIDVLTSHLYRITMHGNSRQSPVANPGLTFVGNFPPCLQDSTIPAPQAAFDTKKLLSFLPNTGTIGLQASFYYIFSFSSPYEPLIPLTGIDTNLFFPGDASAPMNQALISFRKSVVEVMKGIYGSAPLQLSQWPLNIET